MLFTTISNVFLLKVRRDFNQEKLFYIIKPNLEIIGIKSFFYIWGSIEFYDIGCVDDLKYTTLYTWSFLQYLFNVQVIFSIFCYTLWICYKIKIDNEKLKQDAIDALSRRGEFIQSVRM